MSDHEALSQSSDGDLGGLFGAEEEQAAAVAPKEAVLTEFQHARDDRVSLTLIRSDSMHSLWGNTLWNAARYLIEQFDTGKIPVMGRNVLELGSGLGAPSMVAAANGARVVTVTDFPEPVVMDLLRQNVDRNRDAVCDEGQRQSSGPAPTDDASDDERARHVATFNRSRPSITVQPLLWGSDNHIREVNEPTGGSGYDVLILSDLVFNHICHDALLRTVATTMTRSPTSVAYCVFSHHRPRKKADDLAFFDKAADYALEVELVETRHDFPLMFPDDPGDPEVRKPVYCYALRHHYDDAGPPTEDAVVDVVVAGTGFVEGAVSAACAKAGLKVLHVDARMHYGGVFAGGPIPVFADIVKSMTSDFSSCTPRKRELEAKAASCAAMGGGPVDELKQDVARCQKVLDARQTVVDVMPLAHLADGPCVRTLAASQIGPQLNFHNVCRMACVDGTSFPRRAVTAVPLSRADAFKSSALGPMDMRRLMAFVKDLTASMPDATHETPDKPEQEEESPDEATERIARTMCIMGKSGGDATQDPLEAVLSKKYKLSPVVMSLLTLDGALCDAAAISALSGLRLLQRYVTSVGRYGGATPFLTSLYGAAEIPQQLCRMSAVWNSTFVLGRSVKRIESSAEEASTKVGGAVAPQAGVFARGEPGSAVVLSNGQRVHAKCVVIPATGGEGCSGMLSAASRNPVSRAVAIVEGAGLSWGDLEKDPPPKDDATEVTLREEFELPLVVGSLRFSVAGDEGARRVVASVWQQSNATDQAPSGCTTIHALAASSEVTPQQLQDALIANLGGQSAGAATAVHYAACFTLDPAAADRSALGLREALALNPEQVCGRDEVTGGFTDAAVVQAEASWGRQGEAATEVIPIATGFFSGLDDTRYIVEAQHAFQAIARRCGLPADTAFLTAGEAEEVADAPTA